MTDPADYQLRTPPTWTQDIGTLRAVADWVAVRPPSTFGHAEAIGEATGLDPTLLRQSLERWEHSTPPVLEGGGGENVLVYDLTERGRRLAGVWPSSEQVLDRLIAALQQAASDAPDEENRSKLKTAGTVLATIARDIGVAAVGQTLGGLM